MPGSTHARPRTPTAPDTFIVIKPNGVSANGSQELHCSPWLVPVGAPTAVNGRQRIAKRMCYFLQLPSVGAPTGANGCQRVPAGANGCQRIARRMCYCKGLTADAADLEDEGIMMKKDQKLC